MSIRQTFDPFGEPVEGLGTTPEGDRRARRAALAVFWAAALLLTAGRVYVGHIAAPDQVAAASVAAPAVVAPVALASAAP